MDGGHVTIEQQRHLLIQEVIQEVRSTAAMTGCEVLSDKVLSAFKAVPREAFVGPEFQDMAYANHPLPIGEGQTISQPYIVAIMTELLDLGEDEKVLEIGTGCGYQSAVLAGVASEVYSMEIVAPLAKSAEARLKQLGYDNVHVKSGDGYEGWLEHAPYDGIIVTAAAPHIPEPLIQQLKIGKKMVIPVGSSYLSQSLLVVTKTSETEYETRDALAVVFVPLTGSHSQPDLEFL
jgi:protein-L-isoaspartate(D-aspartate) O-methyltransferase